MMGKRNTGIDIFRIFCCIGVLDYHIVDDILGLGGIFAKAIYFAASFCVPGFFLMSGYLLAKKEDLTIGYIENKVTGIMSKLIAWIIFWIAVHFIRTGEMYDLWENITAGITGGGVLPVAWFLFTYSLLLIIGYPAWKLLKRSKCLFCSISVIWMILLAFDVGRGLVGSRTQSLWLHLYIGYFLLGMALTAIIEIVLEKLNKTIIILSMVILFTGSLLYYAWVVKNAEVYLPPHNYYGEWYYSVWLVAFFLICVLLQVRNDRITSLLKTLANNTFVVYLGHLPILLYITAIHPIQSTCEAVLFVILFFIGLQVSAQLFKKMPLLRRLL